MAFFGPFLEVPPPGRDRPPRIMPWAIGKQEGGRGAPLFPMAGVTTRVLEGPGRSEVRAPGVSGKAQLSGEA